MKKKLNNNSKNIDSKLIKLDSDEKPIFPVFALCLTKCNLLILIIF